MSKTEDLAKELHGIYAFGKGGFHDVAREVEKLLIEARLSEIKDFPGRHALMINNTQTVGERIAELEAELKELNDEQRTSFSK